MSPARVWRQLRWILWRELRISARRPGLWALMAGVLLLDGLLFYAFALGPRPRLSEAVLEQLWSILFATSCVLCPLLTMRALSTQGSDWAQDPLALASGGVIVAGKFIAAMTTIALWLVGTTPLVALLWSHGKLSVAQLMVGYLGLGLVSATLIAGGLAISALLWRAWLTLVASALVTVMALLPWALAQLAHAPLRQALAQLSLYDALFRGFMRGQLMSQSVISLLLFTGAGLFIASAQLRLRRGQ